MYKQDRSHLQQQKTSSSGGNTGFNIIDVVRALQIMWTTSHPENSFRIAFSQDTALSSVQRWLDPRTTARLITSYSHVDDFKVAEASNQSVEAWRSVSSHAAIGVELIRGCDKRLIA